MNDPPSVQVEHLSKTFRVGFLRRVVRAVMDVSFSVREGEIFGLLGPNGAGKTTIIKMMMGLVAPDTGRATLLGRPMGSPEGKSLIGYLPENPALYEFLRGDEYLVFVGKLFGLDAAEARRRAVRLIDLVGLSGRADRPIRRFSKGMVQRLAIAQALINDPRLVILDEPMSGLDPVGRKDMRDLILRLKDEGRTVFFSTHILSDVEAICDRVGILAGGRLTDVGTLDQLLSPGVRAVELVADNVSDAVRATVERMTGTAASIRGESVVFSLPKEDRVEEAIRALLDGGGRLIQLTRHRQTLEDLFVARAREPAGGRSASGSP